MATRPKTKKGSSKSKPSWAASGFKAADENFKKSQSKFLPTLILKDEQTAKCRIYDIPGANPLVYRTHSVKVSGYWKSLTCPGKGCPLCAVGNYASPATAFGIKDFRKIKYKGKDGKIKVFHNESRILVLRRNSLPLFKKLASSGKLFERAIEITRYGEKRDTMYHPEVVGRFTTEQKNMEFDLDIHELLAPADMDQLRQLAATFASPAPAVDDDEDDDDYMSDDDDEDEDDDDDSSDTSADDDGDDECENCGEDDCDGSCVADDDEDDE